MGKLKYIAAIFCIIIYLYTTAPFMLWQDAPQLAGAIESFGIAIPAEPVYVFLAHLFTYVPIGSVLFRIHLLNSLLAGVTLLLLYELVVTIILPALHKKNSQSEQTPTLIQQLRISAGLFSILVLAFSYEFWSQAQNVETFILDCLLELIILYLLFNRNFIKSTTKRLLLIFFLCGIATGTDPPVVACLYPLVLLAVWKWKKELQTKHLIFLVISGLIGVILAWSILAFMQLYNPRLDQINGLSISDIWNVAVGGHQNEYNPELGVVNGLTWVPSIMLEDAGYFITTLWNDFTPILYPFIILGCIFLARHKRSRNMLFALLLIILVNFLCCIVYHSGNEENWELQTDVILAIFAGIGFYWISLVLTKKMNLSTGVYPLIGALGIGALLLIYWWPTLNRSGWDLTQDYLTNHYAPLKPPAIMLGTQDIWDTISDYAYATDYKPGVIPVLDIYTYARMWSREVLQEQAHIRVPMQPPQNTKADYNKFFNDLISENISKYRIYITYGVLHAIYFKGVDEPSFQLDQNKFKLIPDGLVEEVVTNNSKVTIDNSIFNYNFGGNFPIREPKYFERTSITNMQSIAEEIALSYDSIGVYDESEGQSQNAEGFLRKAYTLSSDDAQILADLGTFYGTQNKNNLALTLFSKAHSVEPDDQGFLYDMAVANEKLRNTSDEKIDLEAIIQSKYPDPNVAPLAAEKLDNITQGTKAIFVPTGWRLFKNQEMNIVFGYPSTMKLLQINPQMVSISKTSDSNITDSMIVYSTTGGNVANIKLPFSVPNTVQTQNIPLPGFTGTMKVYGSKKNLIEILYLQQKQQIFVIKFPQNQAIDPAIVKGIVQSITSLR